MRGKLRGAVMAVLVVMLTLGGAAPARAAEPVVVEYPDSNFEPGPGWPEGWMPPPPPTAISPRTQSWLDENLKQYPQYSRYEMRVLEDLPKWTEEYPFYWLEDQVGCGETLYVYWYPAPDTQLITKVFKRSFGMSRLYLDMCRFEPVKSITETRSLTPEEMEAQGRRMELQYWMDKSHPGLGRDDGRRHKGNSDTIEVYLNHGHASYGFDVPAYLDPTVNRVRVPIRFVSEQMGARVTWDEATSQVEIYFPEQSREVTQAVPATGYNYTGLFKPEGYLPEGERFHLEKKVVQTPERQIILTIGQGSALVDGQKVPLDAPPVIREQRTMVPIRFIAEQMGAKVYWVGDKPIYRLDDGSLSGTYQVHIYTPFFPLFEYPSWYMENRAIKF